VKAPFSAPSAGSWTAIIANALSIPARLFGENIAATGVDAQLVLHEARVDVHSEHHELSCCIADLRIREIGLGGATGLELTWDAAGEIYAVHVLQADALRRLRSHPHIAASNGMQTLTGAQRNRSIGRAFALLIIAAIVLLPLLIVLLFVWQADRIVAIAADEIGIGQEVMLGDAAFAGMRPSLKLIDEGPALDAVRTLGERLADGSKYAYRFHVIEDESINAFALPGGIIVVHTGLIAATRTPEELAGVLAHEIQHVEQRHSLRGAIKELGLRGTWAVVTGDVGATLAGRAAIELTSRKFSRDDESEADEGAVELLVAQRIDPSAMADFFTTMSEQGDAQVPEFFSTHPASAQRKRKWFELSARHSDGAFESWKIGNWPPVDSVTESAGRVE
jgi:Zn-dependent protease with chaperone function